MVELLELAQGKKRPIKTCGRVTTQLTTETERGRRLTRANMHPYSSKTQLPGHLRSADTGTLFVLRTTTTLGMRSFAVAGPHIWNSLPAAVQTATLSPLAFARHLKSHLFDWD